MILAPSILATDVLKIEKQIRESEKAGATWLHIDIMDGQFVPNLTFGPSIIAKLRTISNQFFDVHLMTFNTEKFIEPFVKAGADGFTVHIESVEDMDKCIELIRSYDKKVAIAISPDTDVELVVPYLDKIDMVLIMSVYPGYGGQSYLEKVNDKISFIRAKVGPDFLIQVDGGITKNNIRQVYELGANNLVAGTAVYNDDVYGSARELIELCIGSE